MVAVDVGHGQLDARLRDDPRVEVHERVNVRTIAPGELSEFDLVVADLSFISLRSVIEQLIGACREGGNLILLVKPQFEAGKVEADRGRGVITDPAVWHNVLEATGAALMARGAVIMGWMVSPVRGSKGNVEFFVHAGAPGRGADVGLDPGLTIEDALAEAALL